MKTSTSEKFEKLHAFTQKIVIAHMNLSRRQIKHNHTHTRTKQNKYKRASNIYIYNHDEYHSYGIHKFFLLCSRYDRGLVS